MVKQRDKRNEKPEIFYLQVDIQSFFVNIDKVILFKIIKRHTRNSDILWLAEKIIFQIPTLNYSLKGDMLLLKSIPAQKSLFGNSYFTGLPIGNLTSQFFANVYLNEIDQFIKHTLKCHYYFRYMDDLLILHKSKKQLFKWQNKISQFVNNKLLLELHPKKKILQNIDKGINFCGYIVKPKNTLIRRRTVKKLKNKLWQFNQKILNSFDRNNISRAEDLIFYDRFSVSENFSKDFQYIFACINSTYGFLKHADCYSLRQSLYRKHFGILKIYLFPANKNYDYFMWDENRYK